MGVEGEGVAEDQKLSGDLFFFLSEIDVRGFVLSAWGCSQTRATRNRVNVVLYVYLKQNKISIKIFFFSNVKIDDFPCSSFPC